MTVQLPLESSDFELIRYRLAKHGKRRVTGNVFLGRKRGGYLGSSLQTYSLIASKRLKALLANKARPEKSLRHRKSIWLGGKTRNLTRIRPKLCRPLPRH